MQKAHEAHESLFPLASTNQFTNLVNKQNMQKAHEDKISIDGAGIIVSLREKLDMLVALGLLPTHEDNNLSQKEVF